MDSIAWLQKWYFDQCNDDWEHQCGVSISTLDNPGWMVTIDLIGTPLQDVEMADIGDPSSINHNGIAGDHSWLQCAVEENRFVGAGGPTSLNSICAVFQKWAESQE